LIRIRQTNYYSIGKYPLATIKRVKAIKKLKAKLNAIKALIKEKRAKNNSLGAKLAAIMLQRQSGLIANLQWSYKMHSYLHTFNKIVIINCDLAIHSMARAIRRKEQYLKRPKELGNVMPKLKGNRLWKWLTAQIRTKAGKAKYFKAWQSLNVKKMMMRIIKYIAIKRQRQAAQSQARGGDLEMAIIKMKKNRHEFDKAG